MGEDDDRHHERRTHSLTDAEFEAISKRAADLALQHVYEEVGKSVLKKLSWAIGLGLTALIAWLTGSGKFPLK